MNTIKQTYEIAATPAQVWRALTDPKVIRKWSDADAIFPLEPGAAYSLWDGTIGGQIVEVVPRKKLAQTWKPENWTRDDSVVTFTLTPVSKGTRVDLLHENVEEWDFEGTREGWDAYYLGAIKRMLEAKPVKTRNTKLAKRTKVAKKVKVVKKVPTKKSKKIG
ncbi:MAG: SRPBCC domain-containing protein [Chloroflexi bacterium]|nr:SRPBCC domain-containing protein [Chloroflexota bacterium]